MNPNLFEKWQCNACNKWIIKYKNATRCRQHLQKCPHISAADKTLIYQSSQAFKKAKTQQEMLLESTMQTNSAAASAAASVTASSSASSTSPPVSSLSNPSGAERIDRFVITTDETSARMAIKMEVECVLARFEPLNRLLDYWWQRSFIQRHPGMVQWLPQDHAEIMEKYVGPIDTEQAALVTENFNEIPGQPGLAVDGATINGENVLVYVSSKGSWSSFEGMTKLEDQAHCTIAERDDGVRFVRQLDLKYGPVVPISADNAALPVLEKIVDEIQRTEPNRVLLVMPDNTHTVDLLAKDLGDAKFCPILKRFIDEVKAVVNLVSSNNIWGCAKKCFADGTVPEFRKLELHADTRMYGVADTIDRVLGASEFLTKAKNREIPSLQEHLASRTTARRNEILQILENATNGVFMARALKAYNLFNQIKQVTLVTSSTKTPASCYLPLVQAMRNSINSTIQRSFDVLFEDGCQDQIISALTVRFNMDGEKPPASTTRKRGLVSPIHIWLYMLDPFVIEGTGAPVLAIKPSVAEQVTAMAKFFVRGDDNDPNVMEKRDKLKTDYNMFTLMMGPWSGAGRKRLSAPPEELETSQEQISIPQVTNWYKKTGGVEARTAFWASEPACRTELGRLVGKHVMGMTTAGSMNVERAIKHVKHGTLSKERNRLGPDDASLCSRSGMNLIMNREIKELRRKLMAQLRSSAH